MFNKLFIIIAFLDTFLVLAQKDCGYIQIQDSKIYYEVSGKGNPVFLLHGGYLSSKVWEDQISYLSRNGFKTIAFDDLGHGQTINGQVDLYGYQIIEELRKKLGMEKISLVGLSWGAMLSIDYALNYPERITKLVLISPGMNGWDYFQDARAQENFNNRQIAKAQNDVKAFIEYFQRNWTYGPGKDSTRLRKNVRKNITEIMTCSVKNHWDEAWSLLSNKTDWDSIMAETLIISGKLDAIDIMMISEKYVHAIPNSKWVEIENVGHTLIVEKPSKINRILRNFLTF